MDWNSSPTKKTSLVVAVRGWVVGIEMRPLAQQVDQLALEPVRVLELVHHDRAEAPALALAHRVVVAEEIAGQKLEIFEVEGAFSLLRAPVRALEALQQLLEKVAVAASELVERCLFDALARLVVARGPFAAGLQLGQVQ
jgi:hypothetical protein